MESIEKIISSSLWDTILKESLILWVIFEKVQFFDLSKFKREGSIFASYPRKKVQFFESIFKKKFNSLSHIQKKVQCFESCKKEKFNFYGSCWQEGFNSESHMENGSVLWVMFFLQKVQFLETFVKRRFNSLSFVRHILLAKILWVVIQKSFCESCSKKGLILCVILWRRFNSLSPSEECSILWVTFQKSSILWVVFKKNVQFFGSEECSIESPKNGFNSLRHEEEEEGSILLSQIEKKLNPLSHIPKKVQVFESFWERVVPILWVVLRVFNSFSSVQKVFDSVTHMRKNNPLGQIKSKKSSILWVVF